MIRYAAGVLLAVIGLAATAYCLRVASAQSLYCRLKFNETTAMPLERRAECAESASRRYRHNYYLSMLLAEDYWNNRDASDNTVFTEQTAAAAQWCERGLAQNPYRRELRWMEVLLAEITSPARALILWKAYVDFAFWDAWNIAGLVCLTAETGRIEEAMELLPLLRGTPQYGRAMSAIEKALRNEPRPGISR